MLTNMPKNWITDTLFVGMLNHTATLENYLQFLIKLNIQLLNNPAISLLGICQRNENTFA